MPPRRVLASPPSRSYFSVHDPRPNRLPLAVLGTEGVLSLGACALDRHERTAKELGAQRPRLTPNMDEAVRAVFQANPPRASQLIVGALHDRRAIVASIVFEELARLVERLLWL